MFALLDERDPLQEIPVIATHMAYRFGGLEYSFDDDTVKRIAARGGLLGLILCQHYITSGLHDVAETFDGSVQALCRHIDKLHELTGGHDHVADRLRSRRLHQARAARASSTRGGWLTSSRRWQQRYGTDVAEQISSGNALRVLRTQWGRKRTPVAAPRAPGAPGRLARQSRPRARRRPADW